MNNDVQEQYNGEERWSEIIGYSAGFALLIACLGLFSLTTLRVTQRTKEIGVRRVLGASVPAIARLLTQSMIRLVVIGTLLAWPLTYFAMDRWLEDFAYHIDLGVGPFVGTGFIILLATSLTVVVQTIRAARNNPTDTLRYE